MDKKQYTSRVRFYALGIVLSGIVILSTLFAMWFTGLWHGWPSWFVVMLAALSIGVGVWGLALTRRQYRRYHVSD